MSVRIRGLVLSAVLLLACPAAPGTPLDDAGSADSGMALGDTSVRDTGVCLCTSAADCDDGVFCNGPETCSACQCVAGTAPCAAAFCHETTDTCDCTDPDADGDHSRSIACGGTDCDDGNPNRFPGNPEVCDVAGTDEDCDPSTFGFRDADGDGAADARCCNHVGTDVCGPDCNDSAPGVNPTAPEVCNAIDDDCDTSIDEMVLVTACADCDGDGHGVPVGATSTLCGRTPTMTGCSTPMGYATTCNDCDDANVDVYGMHPELCDGIDNDCNGVPDDSVTPQTWYVDCDGDGLPSSGAASMSSCSRPSSVPTCMAPVGTCSATLVPSWTLSVPTTLADCDDFHTSVHPGAIEVCDGFDTDCDGHFRATPAEDFDGDGYATSTGCAPCGNDCDDSDAAIHPNATEIPANDRDEDCDGHELCYVDGDGDGFGGTTTVSTTTDFTCAAAGHSRFGTDCCDSDALAFPGQTAYSPYTDNCGSYDYDCNGIDESRYAPVCTTCDGVTCTLPAGQPGWYGCTAPPPCGANAFYVSSCTVLSMSSCQNDGAYRDNDCR